MDRKRISYIIGAAFLLFAAWEAIQHVWLMELPMAAYHMVSLSVELVLVLVITVLALGMVRRRSQQEAHRHRLQDMVVAALAEDLRPPLLSLIGSLRLLQDRPPPDIREETRRLLQRAAASGGVLLDMVEDLLAMSAAAQGQAPACANISPGELAQEASAACRAAAEENGVVLETELAEGLPRVCANSDHALRMLSTLLENAAHATPRGGEVRLRVTRDEQSRTVVFAVTDTAPPLVDHSTALSDPALGADRVGLHYCQMLAEALGGSAWYERAADGNTFAFSLPVADGPL